MGRGFHFGSPINAEEGGGGNEPPNSGAEGRGSAFCQSGGQAERRRGAAGTRVEERDGAPAAAAVTLTTHPPLLRGSTAPRGVSAGPSVGRYSRLRCVLTGGALLLSPAADTALCRRRGRRAPRASPLPRGRGWRGGRCPRCRDGTAPPPPAAPPPAPDMPLPARTAARHRDLAPPGPGMGRGS